MQLVWLIVLGNDPSLCVEKEKGPATLPEETLVCKYESVTKGCSKEECMFDNADIRLTMDASKPIQKPSRIPEIT